MRTRNIYRITIGTLMLVNGIITIFLSTGETIIGTILVVAGLTYLIIGITRHRKDSDGPESDERSKRIGTYGLSYAWLTGLPFMFVLFWLDSLNVVKPDTKDHTCPLNCRPRSFWPDLPDVSVPKRRHCVMPYIHEAGLLCRRR